MRRPKVWHLLLAGPFLVWAGWDTFQDLSDLEEHGGVMYVGRTTKMLYSLGGKWGVLIAIWALALLYGYAVWVTFRREREEREAAAQQPAPTKAKQLRSKPTSKPPTTPKPIVVRPPIAPPAQAPIAIPASGVNEEPRFLR